MRYTRRRNNRRRMRGGKLMPEMIRNMVSRANKYWDVSNQQAGGKRGGASGANMITVAKHERKKDANSLNHLKLVDEKVNKEVNKIMSEVDLIMTQISMAATVYKQTKDIKPLVELYTTLEEKEDKLKTLSERHNAPYIIENFKKEFYSQGMEGGKKTRKVRRKKRKTCKKGKKCKKRRSTRRRR